MTPSHKTVATLAALVVGLAPLGCNKNMSSGDEPPPPPAPPSAIPTARPQPASPPGGAAAASGALTFDAPKQWKQIAPTAPMRKAQFVLPAKDAAKGEPAELTVFHFPGSGGSLEANLERWYGQIQQPDGSPTKAKAKLEKLELAGMKAAQVYVTGTFLKSTRPMAMGGPKEKKPGYALLGAIVEAAGGPWFFKAIGPQATIEQHREAFTAFLRTIKPAGAPR